MKYLKLFRKSVAWAFIILILSVIDTGETPVPDITYIDKLVHLVIYMFLTLLIIYDLKRSGLVWTSWNLSLFSAAAMAAIFGGGMELLQLIPELHRSADVADFWANTAGCAAGVFLFPLFEQFATAVEKLINKS